MGIRQPKTTVVNRWRDLVCEWCRGDVKALTEK